MAVSTGALGPRKTTYLVGLAGLVFFTIGAVLLYLGYDFNRNAEQVRATVTGVEVDYSEDSTTYRPVVRFTDWNGVERSGTTFLGSANRNFEKGTRIDILYDRRDPTRVRMDSWMSIWGFGLAFLAGGVLILAFAAAVAGGNKWK